jgi:pyruvate kinase
MTRRAKIVATVGPSSNTVPMLEKLINAGMNVARVNMSHGTHEGHEQTIKNIRQASKNTGWEVAVLLDLQGPKIRVDKLKENIILKDGETWVIGPSDVQKDYPQYQKNFIPTVYKDLVKDAHVGARILFDDGLMEAEAIEKEGEVLKIKIKVGGELKSNKGINLPNVNVSAPSFTDKDREDLMFGLKVGIDYLALSFVRTKEDIMQVKALLHKLKVNTPIISKIEKPEAIDNILDIVSVSDAIMIARGDMGVEVGNHHVPAIQKKIITLCNNIGKPVITATQMLESMTTNSRPTRAEASDVANAVWDGTDAVMLSGESAAGKYPVEAVLMMNEIVEEAERSPKERPFLRHMDLSSLSASIQVAASMIAEKTHAKWVVSITQSGNSCLKMSRFRSRARVLGVTNDIHVMRKMSLYWGISPYFFDEGAKDAHTLQEEMIDQLTEQKLVSTGDKIVITHGDGKFFKQGTSNSIRVEIIKDIPREKTGQKNELLEEKIPGGKILLDTSLCASCQSCISTCPHNIYELTVDSRRETVINSKQAQFCQKDMQCVEACPTGAIEIITSDL